jgi:hypothetical protein
VVMYLRKLFVHCRTKYPFTMRSLQMEKAKVLEPTTNSFTKFIVRYEALNLEYKLAMDTNLLVTRNDLAFPAKLLCLSTQNWYL